MRDPVLYASATADLHVTADELASSLRFDADDEFPAVFATSRMIALMELAASRVLRPLLEDDELSVGVSVDVVHTAATPPGCVVTATARYLGRDEKHYLFDVSASDDAGEIGRGTHRRAVVSTSRLLAGAAKRTAGAA